MTDAASPAPRKSHRRLIIIVTAVVAVLVALVGGGYAYASSAADDELADYDDAYSTWKSKDRPVLLAATATLPSGTYVREDPYTAKSLAGQKKGCDAVAAQRKKLGRSVDRLPAMATNGLLGTISSSYSDAGDTSDRRKQIVQTYVKTASKTLDQLERDCRWNIAYNAAAARPDKMWTSASKYGLKPGDTEPGGVFCSKDSKDGGCVSSIAKKKNKYADLRVKAAKLYGARITKFYSSKECGTTSYAAACPVMLKAFDAYNDRQLKNYQYIRSMKSSIDNKVLPQNNEALDKIGKGNRPAIRKAVLALDPALGKDKEVRDYPDWTDHFFARTAKLLLARLADERAAIEKL